MKFKVGDKVKIVKSNCHGKEKFIGKIYEIIDNETLKGEAEEWWKLNDGSIWRWCEDELELVEQSTKPCEIKITAKPFKITMDDLNKISNYETEFNNQLYEKFVLGKFNKKEGNEMIESMNLIDLYASKHKESIEKETNEKVEELRKNCDVINKFNELVEQFKKDCEELYLSQFTEEEKNQILLNGVVINDDNMQLRKSGAYYWGYDTNRSFQSDDIENVRNEQYQKISEIDDLVKTVKAHIGIAKTKEEVEEILTRYGIINKKGILVD